MRKTKQQFFPISKYKRPPYDPPKGSQWLKSRKSVRVMFRRPRYETAYAEQWNKRKRRYEIKKYRLIAGYRRFIGRTHIKYWVLQKIYKPAAEHWIAIQEYFVKTKGKLDRKHGKIPLEFKVQVYTDRRGRFFNYLETNTLFNYYKKVLDAKKKYAVAIVYYMVKLSGYKGRSIQFEKMSFGNFPRPMDVFELSVYVENTLVEQIKGYLKKAKGVSFERYMYFGAMAEDELRYAKGKTAGRYPSKEKQREREKKEVRFRLNPKGIK
jgi:hypothetical protein